MAIRCDEGFVKAYFRRGHAYMALGEYELAMGDFEECVTRDPKNQDNLLCLRQALAKLEEHVEQITASDPSTTTTSEVFEEDKDSQAVEDQLDLERQLAEMEAKSVKLAEEARKAAKVV